MQMGTLYLNRYRAERKLAEGGLCQIFEASDTVQSRDVVVKCLRPEMSHNPTALDAFRREIHIHSRFSHPLVPAHIDGSPDGDCPVLVLERIRGLELCEILSGGRMEGRRACRLIGQLCTVLQSAHQQGIVHRDLKPGNILVQYPGTERERIKLIDFGLAQMSSLFMFGTRDLMTLQSPGASGTPEYISPEQIHGQEGDFKSDIYSLGVMFYEMVSGRRPFSGATPSELMTAHLESEPEEFEDMGLADVIPVELEILIRRCMAKYPEQRPPSVEDIALYIEEELGFKVYEPVAEPSTPVKENEQSEELDLIPRGAYVHEVEATLIESLATLKLRGFLSDLGADVIQSEPGRIRVSLSRAPESERQRRRSSKLILECDLNLQVQMQTTQKGSQNGMLVRLIFTSPNGLMTPIEKGQADRIYRNLQAYLR